MVDRWKLFRSFSFRGIALIGIAGLTLAGASCATTGGRPQSLEGFVTSDGAGLAGYQVSLYASYGGTHPRYERIGSSKTDRSGQFRIAYLPIAGRDSGDEADRSKADEERTRRRNPVLFVIAERARPCS